MKFLLSIIKQNKFYFVFLMFLSMIVSITAYSFQPLMYKYSNFLVINEFDYDLTSASFYTRSHNFFVKYKIDTAELKGVCLKDRCNYIQFIPKSKTIAEIYVVSYNDQFEDYSKIKSAMSDIFSSESFLFDSEKPLPFLLFSFYQIFLATTFIFFTLFVLIFRKK
jgi:hypothetical protein